MPVTVICSYRKYTFLAREKISSANNIWFMLAIFLIFFYWTWSHNIYYHSALNHQDTLSGYSKPRQNQELEVNLRCEFRHTLISSKLKSSEFKFQLWFWPELLSRDVTGPFQQLSFSLVNNDYFLTHKEINKLQVFSIFGEVYYVVSVYLQSTQCT